MFKLIGLLLLTVNTNIFCAELTFGLDDAKPYYYFNSELKRFEGPGIKFANDLFERAGIKVKYVRYPQVRLFESVKSKKLDGTIGLIKTKEREEFLNFSKEKIIEDWHYYILTKKSKNLSYEKIIAGKQKICAKNGHIRPHLIPKEKYTLISGAKALNQRLMKSLVLNRCKFILIENITLKDLISNKAGFEQEYSYFKVPNFNVQVHMPFGKHVSQNIIDKVDKAIIHLKKNGMPYEYYHKSFWIID